MANQSSVAAPTGFRMVFFQALPNHQRFASGFGRPSVPNSTCFGSGGAGSTNRRPSTRRVMSWESWFGKTSCLLVRLTRKTSHFPRRSSKKRVIKLPASRRTPPSCCGVEATRTCSPGGTGDGGSGWIRHRPGGKNISQIFFRKSAQIWILLALTSVIVRGPVRSRPTRTILIIGDRHTWDLKLEEVREMVPRFVSEFGHQSPPLRRTIEEALGRDIFVSEEPEALAAFAGRQRGWGGDAAQYDRWLEDWFSAGDHA